MSWLKKFFCRHEKVRVMSVEKRTYLPVMGACENCGTIMKAKNTTKWKKRFK